MEENKLMSGIEAGTDTANVENATETTDQQITEKAIRAFTEEQVNEIVKNRLNKIYKRYGVNDSKGLDDLIGMAQSYKAMKDLYSDMKLEHTQIADENAGLRRDMMFVNNNVNPEKYEEIVALFKGRELELNEANFRNELALHNDWLRPAPQFETFKVGAEKNENETIVDEKAEIARMFGLKGFINK